jgi:hypothetical protein
MVKMDATVATLAHLGSRCVAMHHDDSLAVLLPLITQPERTLVAVDFDQTLTLNELLPSGLRRPVIRGGDASKRVRT